MRSTYASAVLLALAVSACGQGSDDALLTTPAQSAQIASAEISADAAAAASSREATPSPTAAEPSPAAAAPGPVPVAYRKVWAIKAADCTAEPGLTRITISPSAVKFYEGGADVVSVEENGAHELIMAVKQTAEGETKADTHLLKLNDQASTLSYQRGTETFLYRLCTHTPS
jgi:hypothetical protein